jgi:hypothetical protein
LASYLGLDWDQNQLHVVSMTTTRAGVRVDRAACLEAELTLKPAQAEAAGQRLRELLKEAKIPAAPVVACLGRERFILKEIRYPAVSAAEEATLVRFQAGKELTESAEAMVIDYTPLGEPGQAGEQRTFALAARKELLACYYALCRAAGLKLAALSPRSFGMPGCLKRMGSPHQVAAVLTVTHGWAEFCVVRNDKLVFTRSLAVHNGLLAEVRRNLAAYAGQPHINSTRDAVQALYIATDEAHASLPQQLEDLLAIPVLPLEPITERVESAPGHQAGFAGVVGVGDALARQALPINFARPKEPKLPENPEKKRNLVRVLVAAVLLLAGVGLAYWIVSDRAAHADDLSRELAALEATEKRVKPDAVQFEAVTKWKQQTVPYLEEFHDVVAFFDDRPGYRVGQLTFEPRAPSSGLAKKKGDEKYVSRLIIEGDVAKGDDHAVVALQNALNRSSHRRAFLDVRSIGGKDATFKLTVEIAPPTSQYSALLVPPTITERRVNRPAPEKKEPDKKEPEKKEPDKKEPDKKEPEKKGSPAEPSKIDASKTEASKTDGKKEPEKKETPKITPKEEDDLP